MQVHYLIIPACTVGCIVAQLRLIFTPNHRDLDARVPRIPLAYVQPLRFLQKSGTLVESGIEMYSLARNYRNNKTRKGQVVPLTRIWRPVELIPKFGKKVDGEWTCDTAVEVAKEFYLNCFSDKSTYIEVY